MAEEKRELGAEELEGAAGGLSIAGLAPSGVLDKVVQLRPGDAADSLGKDKRGLALNGDKSLGLTPKDLEDASLSFNGPK